jgi:hypothetical protein
MDEKKEGQPSIEFWMDELMKIEDVNQRRYDSVVMRLEKLEQKRKSHDDPEAMLGSLFMFLMLVQVAPLVVELIRQWLTKRSSLESSL